MWSKFSSIFEMAVDQIRFFGFGEVRAKRTSKSASPLHYASGAPVLRSETKNNEKAGQVPYGHRNLFRPENSTSCTFRRGGFRVDVTAWRFRRGGFVVEVSAWTFRRECFGEEVSARIHDSSCFGTTQRPSCERRIVVLGNHQWSSLEMTNVFLGNHQ